jgi:hypothetical protein
LLPLRAEAMTAGALLTDSPLSIVLGNFYLRVSGPVTPTRMFASEAEAIRWLGTFTDVKTGARRV